MGKKKELERLKKAFFSSLESSASSFKINSKNNLFSFILLSIVIISGLSLIPYLIKKSSPEKKLKLSQKEEPNLSLPPQIESLGVLKNNIFIEYSNLKEGTYLSKDTYLVINFKDWLNLKEKTFRIYTEPPLKKISLILKDYLFYSNSKEPLFLQTNKPYLELKGNFVEKLASSLNIYRVKEIRLSPERITSIKIKKIEISPDQKVKGG